MQGVSIFTSQAHFKYKVTYLMQTDSKFVIIFLSFDMYLSGLNKLGVGGGGGGFNYIYKYLMFSACQTRLLHVYSLPDKISMFQMNE